MIYSAAGLDLTFDVLFTNVKVILVYDVDWN